MFSPITAICDVNSSFTVFDVSRAHGSAYKASTSAASELTICLTTLATNVWNFSFLATKSVSEFTSTIAAFPSSTNVATTPSAAILPDFFTAVASPFFLNTSIAAS
jgi:hypothetical protein